MRVLAVTQALTTALCLTAAGVQASRHAWILLLLLLALATMMSLQSHRSWRYREKG